MDNKNLNIYASRYTQESWIKTFGVETLEEWEKLNIPNHLNNFILKTQKRIFLKNTNKEKNIDLTIVPIDEEYFKWLEENNFKNNSHNRKKYISQIVDKENAYRLIKKNNWDIDYEIYGIPIIVETKNQNNYLLKKETKEKIKKYLEKEYGIGNVFIFSDILKCSTLFNKQKEINKLAQKYFEKTKIGSRIQDLQKKEINEIVIPVVIKKEIKTATFDISKIKNENICFDELFKEIEIDVKKDIRDKCFIKNQLINVNDLIECIDDFYDELLNKNILREIEKSNIPKIAKVKIKIEKIIK